jgi:hypothetical protein
LTEACEVRERRAHYGLRTWRRFDSRPRFSRMTSQLRDEPSPRLRPSSQPHSHPTGRCR